MKLSVFNGSLPKIGIRPTIDGRLGVVRESLEKQTMDMAKFAAKLISENLFYSNGKKVECVIADTCIGGAELLVVGDGPVELREGGRHSALRLGIASNELCRYGPDLTKRSRIIRAGADLVIPDFSQMDRLLPLLGL